MVIYNGLIVLLTQTIVLTYTNIFLYRKSFQKIFAQIQAAIQNPQKIDHPQVILRETLTTDRLSQTILLNPHEK